MNPKAIIYKDIPPKLTETRGLLFDSRVEITICVSGTEIVEKVLLVNPWVALIEMQMPHLNGPQCCRQIKEIQPNTKVILISHQESLEALHVGLQSGCDLFAFPSQADQKVGSYLLSLLRKLNPSLVEKRKYPRFETRGFVHYVFGNSRREGQMVNLSKGGILFSSREALSEGAPFLLQLTSPLGEDLEISGKVKRMVPQTQGNSSFPFAIGSSFQDPSPSQLNHLQIWTSFLQRLDQGHEEPQLQEEKKKEEISSNDFRLSSRAPGPIQIQYVLGKDTHEAFMIRFNRGGMLMATRGQIPDQTFLKVSLIPQNVSPIPLEGLVVRSMPLKTPMDKFTFATGVKFINIQEDQKNMLEDWNMQSRTSALPPSPEFVWEILEATPQSIGALMLSSPPDARLQDIGVLENFERTSFGSQDLPSFCLQRLVSLRIQMILFRRFIPTLSSDLKRFGEPYLKLLEGVLKQVSEAENDCESQVRKAVNEGNELLRQHLNLSSNRLHDVKKKMFFELSDWIPLKNLGRGTDVMVVVREQVQEWRELEKSLLPEPTGERRKPKKEEPKSKKEKSGKKSKTFSPMLVGILAGIVFLFSFWNFFLSDFLVEKKLQLPFSLSNLNQNDYGVDLFCHRALWTGLTPQQKEETFQKLEKYLSDQNLRQALIFDENNAPLGEIVSGRANGKIHFSRREYSE